MKAIERLVSVIRKIQMLRSQRGPYRFVVRQWAGLSDINLAANVLNTEFYRNELQPIALPIERLRSILVLAPHQDDETIGAGGLLLKAAAAGVKIDIVYVTDGASSWRPAEWVDTRRAEAKFVCDRLGAQMHELGIHNPKPSPQLDDLDRLGALIRTIDPQVILAPWLLDSPGKHRLVNHLLWLCDHRQALPDCEVWGYQVHNGLLPNGYVDITDVAAEKRQLLDCFRSQNENWACYTHLAMGLAAWNSHFVRSTEPRYVEIFTTLPMREMLHLVESFYFVDFEETYRGENAVLEGARAIHRLVMGTNGSSSIRPQPEQIMAA